MDNNEEKKMKNNKKLLMGLTTIIAAFYFISLLGTCTLELNPDSADGPQKKAPPAPENVVAETKTETSIDLNWNAGSIAGNYSIFRSNEADGPYTRIKIQKETRYTDTVLPDGDYFYYVTLAADNMGESGKSATVPAATRLPTVPRDLTTTPLSESSIKLEWNAVSSVTDYKIYKSTTNSGGEYTERASTTKTVWTDTGLNLDTSYYYKVEAINGIGETMSDFAEAKIILIMVTTLAGSGVSGYGDSTGTAARFNNPRGVAVDASGTVYVADSNNHRIRKITPSGVVTTFAGSGTAGYTNGTGTAAQFNTPSGIAVDASGTVYVADNSNHRIRKITPSGVVTTLAGSGVAGYADGTGTGARFNSPSGVTVDAAGTVYVADSTNHRIRKITPVGVVTTFAGSGTAGYTDGTGTAVQFNSPSGVTVDAAGTVYVADNSNHRIRRITPVGVVTTFAGSGTAGYTDGTGTAVQFNYPRGVVVDAAGNVYVTDISNHRIRKITPAGVVATLAGSGVAGYDNGNGTVAQFYSPYGVAIDAAGAVYIAEMSAHRIRKITIMH
jgi:sugar lactone lactonase YvrE